MITLPDTPATLAFLNLVYREVVRQERAREAAQNTKEKPATAIAGS